MSTFNLSGILTASDAFSNTYLTAVYPAIAKVMTPVILPLCILYLAVYCLQVYGGRVSFTGHDLFQRVFTVFCISASLRWSGFATVIYNSFVGVMNGASGAIMGGSSSTDVIQGIYQNFVTVASQMMSANITAIGIILIGLVLFLINCVFYVVAMFFMFMAKLGLAVVMSLLPLFLWTLMWQSTRQWFFNWLGKMVNFALLYIIVNAIIKFGFTSFLTVVGVQSDVSGPLTAGGLLMSAINDVGAACELVIIEGMLLLLLLEASKWAAALGGGAAQGGGALMALAMKALKLK